ncbi:MAG: hypothetical protein AABW57_00345 [Nanoarchaeota archaeon]
MKSIVSINWQEHEHKLQKLCTYLNERIELHEHKQAYNPSLLKELRILLYYIEDVIGLQGDYNKEIGERINTLSMPANSKEILETLKDYKRRIKNDIFSDFFSAGEDPGFFRAETNEGNIYLGFGKNALGFLDKIRNKYGEIHFDDPGKEIINIYRCEHILIGKQNEQNHRCNLKKGPCILVHRGRKEECPNLENLIQDENNFFEDFITGNYAVKD